MALWDGFHLHHLPLRLPQTSTASDQPHLIRQACPIPKASAIHRLRSALYPSSIMRHFRIPLPPPTPEGPIPPAARDLSGHRLFISAFMIASKVVCDNTYSNKSWAIVGQGLFQLREINQMEREMCGYLEWQLNIDHLELESFTEKTQAEFGSGTVPPILPVTSSVAPSLPKAALAAPSTLSRIPQSYESSSMAVDTASPATIMTSAGDNEDEEELESPSNSLTSSPASSAALNTPPSNTNMDGAGVVSGFGGLMGVPTKMATGGGVWTGSEHKVTLDRHG